MTGEPDQLSSAAAAWPVGPGAGIEQLPQLGLPQHRWGVSGTWGGRIVAIGLPSISPSAASQLKNCSSERKRCDRVAEAHPGVGPLDEEGPDVLAPHLGDPPRLSEERLELLDRLRVRHDRRRRLVLGPQVTDERGQVGQNVRFGYRIGSSVTAGARAHNYHRPCVEARSQLRLKNGCGQAPRQLCRVTERDPRRSSSVVEQGTHKPLVGGSNPPSATNPSIVTKRSTYPSSTPADRRKRPVMVRRYTPDGGRCAAAAQISRRLR